MTLQEFTLTILQTLTPYEEYILRNRFGFSGHTAPTVSGPGPDQRMAREAVQQIEKRSLRKLRQAIDSQPGLCPPHRVYGWRP
jgi:DNA-directed RNA polymerase sigma subunit (sigma70/sigma32)